MIKKPISNTSKKPGGNPFSNLENAIKNSKAAAFRGAVKGVKKGK